MICETSRFRLLHAGIEARCVVLLTARHRSPTPERRAQSCVSAPHAAPAQPAERAAAWVDSVQAIIPAALERHIAEMTLAGTPHKGVVWQVPTCWVCPDLLLPRQLDCRSHACVGCRARALVLDPDLCRQVPGILLHRQPKGGTLMMTRGWLFFMLQELYVSMCVRAARRILVACNRANAMVFSSGARALVFPTMAPWAKALRSMFLEALEAHLEAVLERVRAVALVYNGSTVRGDGNYELACRLAVCGRGPSGRRCLLRPYSAVRLGWHWWCAFEASRADGGRGMVAHPARFAARG